MVNKFENKMFQFIKTQMQQDLAHDINHVCRVVKTAKTLALNEDAQSEIVIPAAYLHDCFSFGKHHKDRAKSAYYAANKAIEFLTSIEYPQQYFEAIHHAIEAHSYSANVQPMSLEAKIVQDADRLDALGAIGIARCLQVSTHLGASLYCSDDPWCQSRVPDDRRFAIDHFKTKLLTLADSMHTHSAKREAHKRTLFMQQYLAQLEAEL